MALNDSWKQFFSAVTSVSSALEVLLALCLLVKLVDCRS